MKLQLDENTLNAYINEAIREEINEGVWDKVANFAAKKATRAAGRAAAKNAPKVITHSPITKTVKGMVPDARRARKFIMSLRRGKPVEGTLETGGKQWRAVAQKGWKPGMKSQNVEFFVKDPVTQKWVKATGKDLSLAKQSFSHHLTNASNLFNSAQRNMLGTGLVAGMGTGWAIDHARNKNNPDAPWNDTPENGGGSVPQEVGFDGTFPWDNTTPNWTPRRPKPTTPTPEPEETNAQPERQKLEPIAPAPAPTNIPTGVTTPEQPGIIMQQPQQSLAQNAVRVMGQTANQSNMGLRDRISTNKRTRQNANNAIDQMVRDGSMSRQQARDDKKLMKGAEKTLRTGEPMN